jgi:hypothetical protein
LNLYTTIANVVFNNAMQRLYIEQFCHYPWVCLHIGRISIKMDRPGSGARDGALDASGAPDLDHSAGHLKKDAFGLQANVAPRQNMREESP